MKFLEAIMDTYRMIYHILFNAITNAIEIHNRGNYEMAIKILMTAQQNTEKILIGESATELSR